MLQTRLYQSLVRELFTRVDLRQRCICSSSRSAHAEPGITSFILTPRASRSPAYKMPSRNSSPRRPNPEQYQGGKSFMDLPPELRNMVYEYLLPESPIKPMPDRGAFGLIDNPPEEWPKTTTCSGMFRINRTIKQEWQGLVFVRTHFEAELSTVNELIFVGQTSSAAEALTRVQAACFARIQQLTLQLEKSCRERWNTHIDTNRRWKLCNCPTFVSADWPSILETSSPHHKHSTICASSPSEGLSAMRFC